MARKRDATASDPNNIPTAVLAWIRNVFADCNARVSEKLSNNPNQPEESLDLTWIEHLSQYSSPVTVSTSWLVKIETHYLGGLHHFSRWEIADLGMLLFIRRGRRLVRSKVALLQSKRLYPTSNRVREERRIDYEIGFARLADPEDLARSIDFTAEFEFTVDCEYGALTAGSDQVKAIKEYERSNRLRVYYQFYNPWNVPFSQRIPLRKYARPPGKLAFGSRVVSAKSVHAFLARQPDTYHLSLRDLQTFGPTSDGAGWPIEQFVADLFATCEEGSRFNKPTDHKIQNLFYRRSGPIAAAIAITIEGPAVGED